MAILDRQDADQNARFVLEWLYGVLNTKIFQMQSDLEETGRMLGDWLTSGY